MKLLSLSVVIATGTSLSPELPINGEQIVGFVLPAAWDVANLTLQEGPAAGTFKNVSDKAGAEYVVTLVAADNRYHTISPLDLAGLRSIKLRSGTGATPVNQTANRTIEVMVLQDSPG